MDGVPEGTLPRAISKTVERLISWLLARERDTKLWPSDRSLQLSQIRCEKFWIAWISGLDRASSRRYLWGSSRKRLFLSHFIFCVCSTFEKKKIYLWRILAYFWKEDCARNICLHISNTDKYFPLLYHLYNFFICTLCKYLIAFFTIIFFVTFFYQVRNFINLWSSIRENFYPEYL